MAVDVDILSSDRLFFSATLTAKTLLTTLQLLHTFEAISALENEVVSYPPAFCL